MMTEGSVTQLLTAIVYYTKDSHSVDTSSKRVTKALSAVFNVI